MANPKHLKFIKQGVEKWNLWRYGNFQEKPNLEGADLKGADLVGADLMYVNLSEANLEGADLEMADLRWANLVRANMKGARLIGADLGEAHIEDVDFERADLREASLTGANLYRVNLNGADLSEAEIGWTIIADVDLSQVDGIEKVKHHGPSSVGIDTIYRSQRSIPIEFLRGAGVPEDLIEYIPSLIVQPIQYYSCFISYSTKDQKFAERLHGDLQSQGVRCWFAPEDIKGGRKLHEQIPEAIRLYDKLLLVLSEHSMNSEWVKTEIYHARQEEIRNNMRKLFPISLVDFDTIREWEAFDADVGKDMAREVREYFIPDFSNWKDHDAYNKAFERLLRDLKAAEPPANSFTEETTDEH